MKWKRKTLSNGSIYYVCGDWQIHVTKNQWPYPNPESFSVWCGNKPYDCWIDTLSEAKAFVAESVARQTIST